MAPTQFPRNLMHVGTAQPLTLAAPLTVPPTGDITLTVDGDVTAKGWLAVPSGSGVVVTVGRGEPFESKYVVSSITVGSSTSTLTVSATDRDYDGTLPQNAPAGTVVEHTISAAEMTSVTDHMRSRQGHGSDGDLVDVNSAQSLSNKTFSDPLPVGVPTANGHAATKGYVDAEVTEAKDAALPKAGGTLTGTFIIDHATSEYSRVVLRNDNSAYWISTDPGASDALTVAILNKDTLAYVKTALTVTKEGRVISSSHVGGVFSGSTDGSGQITVPLPTSPTGNWAVVCNCSNNYFFIRIISSTATSVVIKPYVGDGSGAGGVTPPPSTPVTVHYHAIAY